MTFLSPVATTEFSKFAGILSAALSQHHLFGFDVFFLPRLKDAVVSHAENILRDTVPTLQETLYLIHPMTPLGSLKRWQEYTEELYEKIFTTKIITMV